MHQQFCQSITLCPMNVKQFKSVESKTLKFVFSRLNASFSMHSIIPLVLSATPLHFLISMIKREDPFSMLKVIFCMLKVDSQKKTLTNVTHLLLQIPVKKCKNVPHDACVKIPHQEHKTIKFNTYFFLLIVGYRFIKNFLCSAITLFRRSVTWGHLQIDATTILIDIDFLNI